MKAIVMAGGFGKRLRPFTLNCPKPMLPLLEQPVLAYILELLKRHRFFEVVIATHHLPEQIQDYFGDGRHRGMSLQYSVEAMPLGTAGSVKNAQSYLGDEPFLVISGDIVTDINLSQVVRFHRENNALATLALTQVADPTQYGVVLTDDFGQVRQYLEKPDQRQAISNFVNTGIYVLEPRLLDEMKPDTACDFSYDIFPRMLQQNQALFGCAVEGYWRDMGTIQSYQQCLEDLRAGKVDLAHDTTHRWSMMDNVVKPADTLLAKSLVITNAALGSLREQKSAICDTLQRKVQLRCLCNSSLRVHQDNDRTTGSEAGSFRPETKSPAITRGSMSCQ